jgi:hypothetical protein
MDDLITNVGAGGELPRDERGYLAALGPGAADDAAVNSLVSRLEAVLAVEPLHHISLMMQAQSTPLHAGTGSNVAWLHQLGFARALQEACGPPCIGAFSFRRCSMLHVARKHPRHILTRCTLQLLQALLPLRLLAPLLALLPLWRRRWRRRRSPSPIRTWASPCSTKQLHLQISAAA